jgi:hypothetical protein
MAITHPGDVPNMKRQCAKAADQRAQGVAGWPTFELVRPEASWTRVYTRRGRLVVEKVGGGRTHWPAGHVAWPHSHHLVSYCLGQVD